ncbi:hypothetical protein [Hominilimicola sp.]|uniref:hypothetical protein n=1 Tax=Hominilimicola sp. TaxID=3073571 RepID=UPI00399B4A8F
MNKETLIKYYDLIRPTRCVLKKSGICLEHEDKESYASYFTVNAIVVSLIFRQVKSSISSNSNSFPVDTSMNVEIVENRKALTTVK